MEIVPLVNENPPSFVFSHTLERFDNGQVSGELSQPADRQRRVFHFEGISNKEEVVPNASQNKLRRLLNYFNSGGQLRVYRMYPTVGTAWATSNLLGYSDVIPVYVAGGNYPYYNPAMTQHTFELDGLAINA